jgi:hypothetical protein
MEYQDLPAEIRTKAIELKKKWSNLYVITIGDNNYIFRLLTRGEFLSLSELSITDPIGMDDFVYDKCVVYTDSEIPVDEMNAGIVTSLSELIAELSGFTSPDSLLSILAEKREMMELADSQMIVMLLQAFPNLDIETINEFDIEKLTYHLAIAEQILGVTLDIKKEKTPPNSKTINFNKENKNIFFEGDKPSEFH